MDKNWCVTDYGKGRRIEYYNYESYENDKRSQPKSWDEFSTFKQSKKYLKNCIKKDMKRLQLELSNLEKCNEKTLVKTHKRKFGG